MGVCARFGSDYDYAWHCHGRPAMIAMIAETTPETGSGIESGTTGGQGDTGRGG